MQRTNTAKSADRQRAVSTVLGVGLALVVLVVAAVVWAFVLGGGQAGTGVEASFETSEDTLYVKTGDAGKYGDGVKANLTNVGITHAGGDDLPISQTQIALEGNTSVWGPVNTSDPSVTNQIPVNASPSPNVCKTVGSPSAVISSGQTMHVVVSSGEDFDELTNPKSGGWATTHPFPSDGNIVNGTIDASATASNMEREWFLQCGHSPMGLGVNSDAPAVGGCFTHPDDSSCKTRSFFTDVPMQGDTVEVIWEAASGEDTQRLANHTVQQDSPIAN